QYCKIHDMSSAPRARWRAAIKDRDMPHLKKVRNCKTPLAKMHDKLTWRDRFRHKSSSHHKSLQTITRSRSHKERHVPHHPTTPIHLFTDNCNW
ncbi:hypothetical protein JI435_414430, partial [Parastagonospora nodorum SN15]